MLNDRIAVARPIARKIREAEASLNQSLGLIGQLIAEIPAARTKLGRRVPMEAGVDATEELAAAAVSTARSYRQIVAAHAHFAEDRNRLGLSVVAWGDVAECVEDLRTRGQLANNLHVLKSA